MCKVKWVARSDKLTENYYLTLKHSIRHRLYKVMTCQCSVYSLLCCLQVAEKNQFKKGLKTHTHPTTHMPHVFFFSFCELHLYWRR